MTTDADRAKAAEMLAEAVARWLSDRVQVPEHRAVTASFAFLALPEIVALTSARAEADQLRDAMRDRAADFDANGNGCPLGDPTADTWHKAARILRDLADGGRR